jgi:hypothetical protein
MSGAPEIARERASLSSLAAMRELPPTQGDEPLRAARAVRSLAHWDRFGIDPNSAAAAVRREMIGDGVCLPIVHMADSLVVPVVQIDDDAVRWRSKHRFGARVDRKWWRDRDDARYVGAPPAGVRVMAFLTVGELSRSRSALGRLRPMARTVAIVPLGAEQDTVELSRCDYFSISVVAASHDTTRTLVPGASGPLGWSRHAEFHVRLRQEQLLDLALRAGASGHL